MHPPAGGDTQGAALRKAVHAYRLLLDAPYGYTYHSTPESPLRPRPTDTPDWLRECRPRTALRINMSTETIPITIKDGILATEAATRYENAQCGYFTSGKCRSCSLLEHPPGSRLHHKQLALRRALESQGIRPHTIEPLIIPAEPWGSRHKSKMVVAGSRTTPAIGIIRPDGSAQDLRECPLTPTPLHALMHTIAKLIDTANLAPYHIETQRGELKGVTVLRNTAGTAGILRFILRSTESIPRIKKRIPEILDHHPWVTVVSCNIQPIHAALPEGPEEIVLTSTTTIPEHYGAIQLHFSPQSFMQVTPSIARALYERARTYVRAHGVKSVLDLYCGVGGFLCSVAPDISRGVGVEITESAIDAARHTAREYGYTHVEFHARSVDDYLANEFLCGQQLLHSPRIEGSWQPELVIINPPRRGLNTHITDQLMTLNPNHILYSSCNPDSFARDATLFVRRYELVTVAPFDMFPLTKHCELLAAFRRRT